MKVLDHAAAAAVRVRRAATTLVVREGTQGVEVLMLRRSMNASFMPGSYVFPGGAVDPADDDVKTASLLDEAPSSLIFRLEPAQLGAHAVGYAVAAIRECFEECGLWLGAAPLSTTAWAQLLERRASGADFVATARETSLPIATSVLQPWAHWVTPFGAPKRFDTLFFIAPAPLSQEAAADQGETTALEWVRPVEALREASRGNFRMEFATVKAMESLVAHPDAQSILTAGRTQRQVPLIQPRLLVDGAGVVSEVLLPGQRGYDAAYQPQSEAGSSSR